MKLFMRKNYDDRTKIKFIKNRFIRISYFGIAHKISFVSFQIKTKFVAEQKLVEKKAPLFLMALRRRIYDKLQ